MKSRPLSIQRLIDVNACEVAEYEKVRAAAFAEAYINDDEAAL